MKTLALLSILFIAALFVAGCTKTESKKIIPPQPPTQQAPPSTPPPVAQPAAPPTPPSDAQPPAAQPPSAPAGSPDDLIGNPSPQTDPTTTLTTGATPDAPTP